MAAVGRGIFAAALAVAVAAAIAIPLGGSLYVWLIALGGTAEFAGIILVASPELFPRVVLAYTQLETITRAVLRRFEARIRRLLHLPRSTRVIGVSGVATAEGVGGMSVRVSPASDASLPEQVAYLLRRDQETQNRLAEISDRLRAFPEEWRAEIKHDLGELEQQLRGLVQATSASHIESRLAGIVLLLIGLGLSTAGNLV